MTNLFSVFSPEGLCQLPLNWLSIAAGAALIPSRYWLSASIWSSAMQRILRFVHVEFKTILTSRRSPGTEWLLVSLFFFIGLINFRGLLPYVFTASSHLRFTLRLALPL